MITLKSHLSSARRLFSAALVAATVTVLSPSAAFAASATAAGSASQSNGVLTFLKWLVIIMLASVVVGFTMRAIRNHVETVRITRAARDKFEKKMIEAKATISQTEVALGEFKADIATISDEFPTLNVSHAKHIFKAALSELKENTLLVMELDEEKTGKRDYDKDYATAERIIGKLNVIISSPLADRSKFSELRIKAEGAPDRIIQVRSKYAETNNAINVAINRLSNLRQGFDQQAFSAIDSEISLAQGNLNKIDRLLAKASDFVISAQNGRAIETLDLVCARLDTMRFAQASIHKAITDFTQIPVKRGEIVDAMQVDLDYILESDDRARKANGLVDTVKRQISEFRAIDFSTGNPVKEYDYIQRCAGILHQFVSEQRAYEQAVIEAQREVPRLHASIYDLADSIKQYASNNQSRLRSYSDTSEVDSLVVKADAYFSTMESIDAFAPLVRIRSLLEDIQSGMESKVRRVKNDEEDERRKKRRRRARRNASYGGYGGFGYDYY